jgi:hypothetical protein
VSPRLTSRAKGPQLPGKHSTAFPLRRYGFIAGAATLLVVLVSWVAIRAVGPAEADQRVPLMVQPTIPLATAAPSVVPLASVAPLSAAPSTSSSSSTHPASPSASPAVPASRKPTKKAAPRRTTAPPAAASFTAAYRLGSTWDRGFVAGMTVTNKKGPARGWTVRITYGSEAGVRLDDVWNADVSREGDTFVLTGGPLAPGASVTVGYRASKQVRSQIQPSACTVDGTACELT